MFESAAAALFGAAGGLIAFAIPIAEGQSSTGRRAAQLGTLVALVVVGAGAGFGVWIVNNAGTSLDSQAVQTGHIAGAFLGGIGGPATLRGLMSAHKAERSANQRAAAAEHTAEVANQRKRRIAGVAAKLAKTEAEAQQDDDRENTQGAPPGTEQSG